MSKSTAPLARCAITDRALDTTMDANDVPMATLTRASDGGVKKRKNSEKSRHDNKSPAITKQTCRDTCNGTSYTQSNYKPQ